MPDPIVPSAISPVKPLAAPQTSATRTAGGEDFAATLRAQLEQVSRMQAEAEAGMQGLMTGQTTDVTAVLAATRKAEVAFSLLMEIRNKLVDAYAEVRQLRV